MKYLGSELAAFSEQIQYALDHYQAHQVNKNDLQHIVVCGLGGSGIAGRLVKNYFTDKLDIPVESVSDYILPRYVNEHSLVILSSYSGNTEETCTMYSIARERGAKVIVISVGGALAEKAEADGVVCYRAVGGFQPRVALGYSITYLFLIFFELLKLERVVELKQIAGEVQHADRFRDRALELLKPLEATIRQKYVIIADTHYEAVAVRLAQQIQENAKLEAFISILPEANHNMIETYYGKHDTNFIFLNSGMSQRTNLRMHFIKNLLKKYESAFSEVPVNEPTLNHLFDKIYLLDWFSLALADKVGAVSNEIENINQLKEFLNKN